MRAVRGAVVSSRPISLSKAATILGRFAAGETGGRPEVAAYLRRASAAVDDLVRFHREIRASRKRPELETHMEPKEETNGDDSEKRKKNKRKMGENSSGFRSIAGGENPSLTEEERNPREGILGEIGVLGEGNLTKGERNRGGEVELTGDGGVDGSEDGRHEKRKKKKKKREVVKEEKSKLDRNNEVAEERHKERKKKKKGKREGKREEEAYGRDLDGEGRDRDKKRRKHLGAEEERGDSNDQSERHKRKKKKRRKTGAED